MLFIARRSDSKDGAVPPEPVGPMEVAGSKGQDGRRMLSFIDRFKSSSGVRQQPSEIVTVFLTQDAVCLSRESLRLSERSQGWSG